ncbi:hypothetical protein HHK36_012825 [Tetracentron sinense]|uniref:Uncharacterized protein n=1 Tax=Tetracentron sinense TaxID=13715 RepID=A0A834Z9S4_TETSI|nr:hypothetical protein HHK36_012825 [Tetracentron sinense]
MVRAPCCEKMGLTKGPWTPEEDEILISYIQQYGHGNWRALPKQADTKRHSIQVSKSEANMAREPDAVNYRIHRSFKCPGYALMSPQQSSSDFSSGTDSSVVTGENNFSGVKDENIDSSETFPEIDENFWWETLPAENSTMPSDLPQVTDPRLQFPFSPVSKMESVDAYSTNMDNGMDFWYNLFIKAGETPDLPEF